MAENKEARNHTAPLYVIGDIHGRLDLLDRLIKAIHRDVGANANKSLTVTLGDYVDRGPNSRGVINRLSINPFPGEFIALKGNHEELLQNFLSQPESGKHWRQIGGFETLRSFGIPVAPLMKGQNYDQAAEQLHDTLSPTETAFLGSLRLSLTVDRFFLCHAGVRPGVPLDRQTPADLLWIRDEFLNSNADFGKLIIHGHSPVVEPEIRANRINIDTGAFATGRLTCAVIEADNFRFMAT
jgi:serine/threonine protein phosphatase 1